MFEVTLSPGLGPEQRYILEVLLGDFLRVPFVIADRTNSTNVVTLASDGKQLTLPQSLLSRSYSDLLVANACPSLPLDQVLASAEGVDPALFCSPELPVLFGRPGPNGRWIERSENRATIHLDILGGSFFMLTRMEELIGPERDIYGRFPATSAVAYQGGFLNRPIVNEYAELLWTVLTGLWPGLQRAPRNFSRYISHDVDLPFAYAPLRVESWLKTSAGDLLKRGKPGAAGSRLWNGALAALRLPHRDPMDTFDWLMDQSEELDQRSTFYFMTGGTNPNDGRYPLGMKPLRRLVRKIADRGHGFGLHPSYETMTDSGRLASELEAMRQLLAEERIKVDRIGARQHFLRWEAPATWQIYEDNGLAYDTSVCYANCAGFRCGTCYEFPVFNVVTRKKLKLIERPLLIMDGTLFNSQYMNMDHETARDEVLRIKRAAQRYSGTFTTLWHNSWFARGAAEKDFYRWMLSAA